MAIITASADLNSLIELGCRTGFVQYSDGYIDVSSGFVKAIGRSSWSQLSGSTWNDFSNYVQESNSIKWTAPLIDLGFSRYFTLNINLDCEGECSFLISVSTTGEFGGEEEEYIVTNNNFNVPAFFGQYVYVTAFVSGPILRRMTVTYDTTYKDIKIQDVDSSTLPGTASNRTIVLPEPVSRIADIVIQPKAVNPYNVNLYVSAQPVSEVVIPLVKSKNTNNPSFALYGIDNDPRDAVVDIIVTALPRMVMENNNLQVIQ
jgi:hypothetical protein